MREGIRSKEGRREEWTDGGRIEWLDVWDGGREMHSIDGGWDG